MKKKSRFKNHAVLKSLTFRISVLSADFFVLALLMDSAREGGIATLIRHFIQVFMYWYHERAWSRVTWGIVEGVETSRRALVKTLTYRAFASGKDLFVIVFLAGDMRLGVIGTLIIAATNSVIYYSLERAWIVEERWENSRLRKVEA